MAASSRTSTSCSVADCSSRSSTGGSFTPLFVLLAAGGAYVLTGERRTSVAVLLGGLSHLVLDSLTVSGIMWLYPFDTQSLGVGFGIHGLVPTLVLWSVSVLAVAAARR